MTKSAERNLVIGLDVGTSKVVATVGEITTDNKLSIVGVGSQVSYRPFKVEFAAVCLVLRQGRAYVVWLFPINRR